MCVSGGDDFVRGEVIIVENEINVLNLNLSPTFFSCLDNCLYGGTRYYSKVVFAQELPGNMVVEGEKVAL
jgi:hypothetical protein